MITIISALDIMDGIGDKNGNLLYNIPEDLKHFKETTMGGIVVMGRKTWDSLKRKPLEGRKNYIVTRDKKFSPEGAKVVHSIDDILKLSEKYSIYIIGGQEIYTSMIEYADNMILTHVHGEVNMEATSFFPQYDHKEWDVVEMVKHESTEKSPSFTITKYRKIK